MKRRPRIGKRVTSVSGGALGFSAGVSWETVPDIEREVLMRLVPFLEDRRVLYNPSEVEVPSHCVDSVVRMRRFLVEQAGLLPQNSDLGQTLRSMAGACRRFLDRAHGPHSDEPLGRPMDWGFNSWVFNQALGELRGQVGIYLQDLLQHYELDLGGPLRDILPPPAER